MSLQSSHFPVSGFKVKSSKAHLQSLEVKIPQMINDFKLTFNKHIEESNKLKQELKETKDQAKTGEDKNEVFNLKAMLKASEAKLKNKEKEITNLSKKSNEAAKNVKSKDSQLDDANKKIKKLQEEVKQKTYRSLIRSLDHSERTAAGCKC